MHKQIRIGPLFITLNTGQIFLFLLLVLVAIVVGCVRLLTN